MNLLAIMSLVDLLLGIIDKAYASLKEIDKAAVGLSDEDRAKYRARRDSALARARSQVDAQS